VKVAYKFHGCVFIPFKPFNITFENFFETQSNINVIILVSIKTFTALGPICGYPWPDKKL